MTVENRGNIQQAFTLTWQSPDDGLDFEPAPAQELRIPPGEVAMAEFRAKPRSRPLFGGERALPFTTRVQAAEGETQNLNGEVVGKALIPSWVLPAVLVSILAIACISVLFPFLGGSPEEAPPEAPAATATPGEEQPAPTEPPAEVPTEAPPAATHRATAGAAHRATAGAAHRATAGAAAHPKSRRQQSTCRPSQTRAACPVHPSPLAWSSPRCWSSGKGAAVGRTRTSKPAKERAK